MEVGSMAEIKPFYDHKRYRPGLKVYPDSVEERGEIFQWIKERKKQELGRGHSTFHSFNYRTKWRGYKPCWELTFQNESERLAFKLIWQT